MSLIDELREDSVREEARRRGQNPELAELAELAKTLHERGIDFRIEGGRVFTPKTALDTDRETKIELGSDHIRIGVISDTHLGSKYEQLSALRRFYEYCDERETDFNIHVGDLTQGIHKMHRGMELEIHSFGADAQVDYATRVYPASGRGTKTYMIGGNHDDSFLNDGGVNVVRRFADQREDIVYLGQDAAYLTVGNLRSYLVHPDGGRSYAKSYKPQKIAEGLPVDKRLAVIFIGHYHSYGAFKQQDAWAFMVPCFQSQYTWLARKGLYPDIGGMIVDLWLDDDGWPRRVAHEFADFRPVENDWDHEVSREVSRAWSSNGLRVG